MADARVDFVRDDAGVPKRFEFACPRVKGQRCGWLSLRPKGSPRTTERPQWEWDGDEEKPTFSPSVNCRDCWHGFIESGRTVRSQGGPDEPEPA